MRYCLMVFVALLPCLARAQSPDVTASLKEYRDPRTAIAISVLIPGGGQVYAGRPAKGVGIFAVAVGSAVAGAALSTPQKCGTAYFTPNGGGPPTPLPYCNPAKRTPLYVGIGAYVASWVYGWATAGGDARAHNRANGIAALHPVLSVGERRVGLGLSLAFGR